MKKTNRTRVVAATLAGAAMIVGVLALAQPAEAFIFIPAPIPDCFVVLCAPCPEGTYSQPVPDECCPECIPLQEY